MGMLAQKSFWLSLVPELPGAAREPHRGLALRQEGGPARQAHHHDGGLYCTVLYCNVILYCTAGGRDAARHHHRSRARRGHHLLAEGGFRNVVINIMGAVTIILIRPPMTLLLQYFSEVFAAVKMNIRFWSNSLIKTLTKS